MASRCATGSLDWILGNFFFRGKGRQVLVQAVQGSCGVPIPETVNEAHGCGAWGQGSVVDLNSAGETVGDHRGLFQPKCGAVVPAGGEQGNRRR